MMAASPTAGRFHGIVVIDKPAGWTSHDVVARMRRLLGERHIGHAGTLDPAATGVLPVMVGEATKVVEYLSDESKTYLADVTFGVSTDSYDIDGQVVSVEDPSVLNRQDIEAALTRFSGEVQQIPPMHSALKIGGKRLYELARAGQEIERAPRTITINEIVLVDWQPPVARILIDCTKGTYIRSIARDLGEALGVGAYLSNLVRIRTGAFSIEDAWTLDQLAQLDFESEWPSIAIHPDQAMHRHPAILLDVENSARWRNGGNIRAELIQETLVRVYDEHGQWLGIGRFDSERGAWRPVKVAGVTA